MTTVNEITTDRLKDLAAARVAPGRVLSIYVDLDPSEFATAPARATELRSVLDEADRTIREDSGLTHQERVDLQADLARVTEFLQRDLDASGAHGLAIFCARPAELFEVLKLPRPVPRQVRVGESPYVEPLARIGASETWWIVLVDRRRGRLLAGTGDGLEEVWSVDDGTSGQHDQGGWSQANYQRAIDKEAGDHLRNVADELHRRLRAARIDGLLIGGAHETVAQFESLLHPDVARCVAGRFDGEVANANPDDVLRAAAPHIEEFRRRRDTELLERFTQARGTNGRAAAGLPAVLAAVHERRIETLFVRDGFHATGVRCPRCGWLGVTASAQCPADGTTTEIVKDVVEAAVEATFTQDGRVRLLDDPAVEAAGGIGALLRY